MPPTRSVLVMAILALVSLPLTSCSGVADPESPASGATSSPRVAGNPDTWPLTGLPVKGAGSSVRRRPVLVVKMDNTAASAPQRGLSAADMVVEELVEGGLTRLAAFYYSKVPGETGPVRSMRASDIDIVAPASATVVTSGAARVTIALIGKAGIKYVTEGAAGFARDSGRQAPYNLMADLGDVAATARQPKGRPSDYLDFGSARDLPRGPKANEIRAQFSGGHTTTWRYERGRYANVGTFAASDDQFPADTVLVLRVEVGDAGYRDPAGNPVPRTELSGTGRAQLFHGGRVVPATWSKKGADGALHLATPKGTNLEVPSGRTWIELVPKAGNVTYN